MSRLLALPVVLLVVALAALAGTAGRASALTTEPILDPVYSPQVDHYLNPTVDIPPATSITNPVTSAAIDAGDVAIGEGAGELAAGTVASIPTLTVVAAGAIAGYVGWRIGSADYKAIHDLFSTPSPTGTITTVQWVCYTGSVAPSALIVAPGASCAAASVGSGAFSLGSNSASVDGGHGGYVLQVNGFLSFCQVIATGAPCAGTSGSLAISTYAEQFQAAGTVFTGTTAGCGASAGQDCINIWRSAASMAAQTVLSASNATDYAAAPGGQINSQAYSPPAIAVGSSNEQAAKEALCAYQDISTCTASQAAARCSLDAALEPGYDCHAPGAATGLPAPTASPGSAVTPFLVPAPGLDEDYAAYRTRLRDLGYVGSVALADEDMTADDFPDASYAARLLPGSVTGVKVGTVEIPRYDLATGDAADWDPSPADGLITPGTTSSVTIYRVASSYDPSAHGADGTHPPTGGGSGGGGGSPGVGVDFSPLTSLSFGCTFPFGFICYAEDVSAWFNVTPEAPDFNLDVPDLCVAGTCYTHDLHYEVDLSGMNTYMGWMRDLITVTLTIGIVYWVAAKFLGFDAAGDPSEAMEHALHEPY